MRKSLDFQALFILDLLLSDTVCHLFLAQNWNVLERVFDSVIVTETHAVVTYPCKAKGENDMAHKYLVTLTAGEDGYIVAECPALPGCVSQGKTREEALRNIQEAIEGIIEVRKVQQLPIPSPDIVEISVAA